MAVRSSRVRAAGLIAAGAALGLLLTPLSAQQPAPAQQPSFRAAVDVVSLNVTVTLSETMSMADLNVGCGGCCAWRGTRHAPRASAATASGRARRARERETTIETSCSAEC